MNNTASMSGAHIVSRLVSVRRVLLAVLLLLPLGIFGCQAKSDRGSSHDEQAAVAQEKWAEEEEGDYGGAEAPGAMSMAVDDGVMAGVSRGKATANEAATRSAAKPARRERSAPRMIVYNAWMRLAGHRPSELLAAADQVTLEHGGYAQSSTLSQRIYRVPSARYASFVAALQALGEVRSLRQTSHDVTEEFQNVEARIANLQALRARYEELLVLAKTMEERLTIERELRRIAQDLRVLEERRRHLADQASFATVTLDVEPIVEHVARRRRAQPFPWVSSYGLTGLFG